MLPYSEYPIRLAEMTFGEREITRKLINLPSRLYTWVHDPREIGEVNDDGIFYSKDKLGECTVTVHDTRYVNNTAETYVHVVEPAIIDIEIIDITEELENNKTVSIKLSE